MTYASLQLKQFRCQRQRSHDGNAILAANVAGRTDLRHLRIDARNGFEQRGFGFRRTGETIGLAEDRDFDLLCGHAFSPWRVTSPPASVSTSCCDDASRSS